MFIVALFVIAKLRNQFLCPSTDEMNKENVVCIYTRILFNHIEEWNYAIDRKIDRTRDHHVKQNKPDSER
jgi:hypothetical protein